MRQIDLGLGDSDRRMLRIAKMAITNRPIPRWTGVGDEHGQDRSWALYGIPQTSWPGRWQHVEPQS